ncbi:MAG: redoxin domain-containing protein [Bacteroidota bacterium]
MKIFRLIVAWFVFVMMLGFPGLVQSLMAQEGHKIEVKIEGFDQKEAYLAYYYWDKQYIQDTASVTDGKFTFEGPDLLDQGVYMVVLPPSNTYFEVLIGEDQEFKITTDTVDLAGNIVVEESEENILFYQNIHLLAEKRKEVGALKEQLANPDLDEAKKKELNQAIQAINTEVAEGRSKIMEGEEAPLYGALLRAMREPQIPEAPKNENDAVDSTFAFRYYKSHFFDHLPLNDYRLAKTPVYYNKIKTYLDKLTYQQPDSIIASIDNLVERARGNPDAFQTVVGNLLNQYAGSKIMGMDAVYVHMVETYYLTGEAFWADPEQVKKMEERALAISPTLIGRKAPNLTMKDSLGQYQTLYNIKGEYTLLYFWDYDCGHCQKETPKLAKAHKKWADKGVALYTVSINGSLDKWRESIRKYGLSDVNVQDHERKTGFDSVYDIRSTPRLFILDKDKIIKAKHISVEQLDEILPVLMDIEEEESKSK